MTNAIKRYSGAMQPVPKPKVDRPASDELARAEALADKLARAVELSRYNGREWITLDLNAAEELAQLLFDSLRTAKQLQGQV